MIPVSFFQWLLFVNFSRRFFFLVLPSSVENGGGQGETGQGRDSKSYTGIRRLTVHPESTTVSSVNADEYSTELTDSGADGFNHIRSDDGGEEEIEHGDGDRDGERKESIMTILPLCFTLPIRFSTITNPTFPSQLLFSSFFFFFYFGLALLLMSFCL